MSKRWIALVVSCMMALSLAGCSQEISDEYVTIKKYKKLEIPKIEKTEVTDDSVEYAINSQLSKDQEREEVTGRAAANGDTVDIDYVGTSNGVEFAGGSASGVMLILGSGQFVGASGDYKGFEEQIEGRQIGENFDIQVQFPENYRDESMAGAVANFNITLNAIYENKLPELTDEWVKENSEESKTVEEYKEEVRKRLEENSEQQMTNALQSSVLEALMDETEVKKFPEDEVKAEYKTTEDNYKRLADGYGLEFEEFLSTYMNMTMEDFEKRTQESSERIVKANLACRLLAEKKRIEPTEKEYEEEIKQYAENAGYDDVEEFKKNLGEEMLKNGIRQRKVADYLVERCVQVESSEIDESGS